MLLTSVLTSGICCYFRPTNSSAFQCTLTVIFKYKRHFFLPITAQLEAAPNSRAACRSTACLQHTTEPCRLSYLLPTEVWSFPWQPFPFGALAMTFLCLPPLSTTLQFWWKQSPDWGTQRQQLFLETSCSRGVESNHKLQLYNKI